MVKRKRKMPCALCGETHEVTREHVPPKNLFLAPRPANTITVPVCKSCNHEYHLDDEYFRVYVATGAESGTRHWRLWNEKVVGSSFVRGKGLKGRLRDDRMLAVRQHRSVEPLRTFDGQMVDEKLLPQIQPFDESRINLIIEKIVRCLHYYLERLPLAQSASLEVDSTPLEDIDLRSLFERRTGHVGDHDEFIFRREHTDPAGWRWLLAFYVAHTFTVHVHSS